MHSSVILRRCLSSVLEPMHAARCRVLLKAVEALVAGRRLTLTDLARTWPGAQWMHAPLKALDRLLSNRHLQREVQPLHQAMAAWLIRAQRPIVVVDWSDLKADGRWCLLRAAVPMGGRTLTVCERIFPIDQLNSPQAQKKFLKDLRHVLPKGVTPTLVTDAAEVAEAVGRIGDDLAPVKRGLVRDEDELPEDLHRVWQWLRPRASSSVDEVMVRSGLALREVLSALGELEERGVAEQLLDGWRRRAPR